MDQNRAGGFWRALTKVLGTGLLVLLCALAALVAAVPAATGGRALAVLSGSMEPAFRPGDLLIVTGVKDPEDLRLGDVITYLPEPDRPDLITHRVVGLGVDAVEGRTFTTRGDANPGNDPTVYAKQVRGKLWLVIPRLGHVTNWAGGERRTAAVLLGVGLIGYGAWQFLARPKRPKGPRPDPAQPAAADRANLR